MRIWPSVRLLSVLSLLATPAAAQPAAEDGIRAVLGGDYQNAARILRPLADDASDPVAQFFLAILYDTGQGVRRDPGRACGLFLRSATRAHPFAEQSASIAAAIQQQLGAGASFLCVADERWQGGPPQSFLLGPAHRVIFADTSITVMYRDAEQRSLLSLPAGGVFLPIQHTPLNVTHPVSARRHFFQWFRWMPDSPMNPSRWTLGWMLSEVAGDRWIPITGEESLLVLSGPTRPASYDPAGLVRLSVNETGQAEFTIVGATPPRTEVIPWQGSR